MRSGDTRNQCTAIRMHHLMPEKFAEILAWSNGVEWRMKAVLTGSKSNVFAFAFAVAFQPLKNL